MLKHSRRSFLLALPALPLAAKAFVRPSRAAVGEFQAIPITPVQPIGGSFTFMGKVIPWNATPEQMAEILSDKHCKVTATNDYSFIIEFIGGK